MEGYAYDHKRLAHFMFSSSNRKIRQVLDGKGKDQPLGFWRKNRFFIAEAIDKPGTIFDPSCGSSAMLYSLSYWSKQRLVPSGVDSDKEAIDMSKKIFPKREDHFIHSSFEEYELPQVAYDYVYWSMFTNFCREYDNLVSWVNRLKQVVGRRLIIAFYDDILPGDVVKTIDQISDLLSGEFADPRRLGGQRTQGILAGFEAAYFDRLDK